MYELPIQITTEVQNSIQTDVDESVYKVIQKYGINVDKEELIRALKYDREQYKKGYSDGVKEFAERLKLFLLLNKPGEMSVLAFENIDYLLKEMVGEK